MLSKQTEKYPVVRAFDEDDSFKFKQTLNKYLFHWPLFVLALLFAICAAIAYLKVTKPVYDIYASLIIKEDNTVTNNSRAASVLQELDISETDKLVDNEIEVIKSRSLIAQVVKDLGLYANYQSDKKINKQDLYGQSPVKLTLLTSDARVDGRHLLIYIKDSSTFYLTENKVETGPLYFSNTIKSNFGTWRLTPTPNLQDYIGKSLIISLRDIDKVVDDYQSLIDVSLMNKKSPTISLLIHDENKNRGIDILNHLITVYNSATLADKNRITQSTLKFIDSRAQSVAFELDSIEKRLEQFRSSRGITDISTNSRIFLENQQDVYRKLNDVSVRLQVIRAIENYVSSNLRNKSVPSTLGIDDPGLNSLIEKLTMLELDRDGLLTTTPETNPIFEPLNTQIAATKDAIKAKLANIKTTLLNEHAKLQSIGSGYTASVKDIPVEERGLVAIQRQQGILQDLYIYLLKKREEASLSYASTIADARVIDSAYAGPLKWPNKVTVYGLALLVGFLIPILLLLFRKAFNDCISSRDEIENATDAPVLAKIDAVYARHPIVINDKNNVAAEEQFRFLRTKALLLHGTAEKGRITLVTSSIAQEGKAFIASNLGISLAVSGRKVVIIDLDLRRQKIARIFNLPTQYIGLTDYLKQDATVKEIIQVTDAHPNLHVIANGQVISFPTELIEHLDFDNLIRMLRNNYDDIIIIAPPIKLATDAIVLAGLSGLVLYIVRYGYTRRSFFPFIQRIYESKDLGNMQIVFNGVRREPVEYDYGKGYYPKVHGGLDLVKLLRQFLRRF